MVSEATPTMVEEWTFVSITLHIAEIAVVYPPGVMKFGELCIEYVLLPVEPPEIDSFLLHRMHHLLEHIAHKLFVRIDPFYAVLGCRILAETLCEGRVALFPMVETVRRVEIQSHLQPFILQKVHKLAWVREYALVPGPSGPSSATFVGIVPVHIDNEHVKRNVVCVELVNQCPHFLVGICPIAAPPVSEGETWRKRHLACKDCEILESCLVVVAVCHKVPVLALLVLSLLHPGPLGIIEEITVGFVDQSPAVF